MTRLIDADSLEADCNIYDAWDAQIVKEWLNDQPTVDAEPVRHGYWKYGEKYGIPNWECSVCGCHGRGDYNYCPWCGAKMYEDKRK